MSVPRPLPERANVPMVVAFAAFTLWDYYIGPFASGYRVFDLAAAGLLLTAALGVLAVRGASSFGMITATPARWLLLTALPAIFVIAAMVGIANDVQAARPAIGVLLGLFVWLMFHTWRVSPAYVGRLLSATILVHVAALLLQLAVYHGTGHLINYQEMLGAQPRVFGATLFRPSGLFLEPSSYSASMIMLVLLRIQTSRAFDAVAAIALATVLATLSLFGFLAAVAVTAFLFWRRLSYWIVVALVAVGAHALLEARADLAMRRDFVVSRVTNIATDESVTTRVGRLFFTQDPGTSWGFWFGHGLSNEYTAFGASGLGYVMNAVGLVGLLTFLATIAITTPRHSRVHVTFAVVLCLVAAPMWTMMLWWAWIGLLTNNNVSRLPVPIGRCPIRWRLPSFTYPDMARA